MINITIFFLSSLQIIFAASTCQLDQKRIVCSASFPEDLTKNFTLMLKDEDIKFLNLSGGIIYSVHKDMLRKYKNLENLDLSNCRIAWIDQEAFKDLHYLKTVSLADNYLKNFSFSFANSIENIDLSNNLLTSLKVGSKFPKLKVLNLSSNMLSFLPRIMLEKLKENNGFYALVSDNPWNCSDTRWKDYLNELLNRAFCQDNVFQIQQRLEKMNLMPFEQKVNPVFHDMNSKCSSSCKFLDCIFWIFGGVWFGIIIGNVFIIRKLIFKKQKRFDDKSTQFDFMSLGFR